jgi:hypothetical protein
MATVASRVKEAFFIMRASNFKSSKIYGKTEDVVGYLVSSNKAFEKADEYAFLDDLVTLPVCEKRAAFVHNPVSVARCWLLPDARHRLR